MQGVIMKSFTPKLCVGRFLTTLLISLAVASSTRIFAAEPLSAPEGLVGWWTGNGVSLDSTGTNHAILVGATNYAPAKVGDGFNITAFGRYARILASPSLNVGIGAGLTLEA